MSKGKRKMIEVRQACDINRLYAPLAEAIVYLQEVQSTIPAEAQGFALTEHWTGYEDMEMVFVYGRLETDAELAARLKQEALAAQRERATRNAEIAKNKRYKQWKRLNTEFGR